MNENNLNNSPIEEYLDGVLVTSAGIGPRALRHLLAETEAHLRDIASEEVRAGSSPVDAERAAIARFGSIEALVEGEAAGRVIPLRALLRPTFGTALLLGGLAGVAAGVSGLITALMGYLGGSTFIVNISRRTYLSPSDCARWLSQNHSTHSCYQAALQDWSFEVVAYRIATGVIGLLMLVAYLGLRRRWSAKQLPCNLPRHYVDAVAFVAFTGFGVWLAGMGVDSLIVSAGRGAGQGLGTAPAMLALGAIFGWRLIVDLRTPPARTFVWQ